MNLVLQANRVRVSEYDALRNEHTAGSKKRSRRDMEEVAEDNDDEANVACIDPTKRGEEKPKRRKSLATSDYVAMVEAKARVEKQVTRWPT